MALKRKQDEAEKAEREKEQELFAEEAKKTGAKTAQAVETSAMKAYSLAIAQAAENNEPDEPVTYTTHLTDEEKDAQKTKDMT